MNNKLNYIKFEVIFMIFKNENVFNSPIFL